MTDTRERPILFQGAMVRAILDGTKTQTRRVMKCPRHYQIEERDDGTPWPWMYDDDRNCDHFLPCPYGQPGDRLWCREAWRADAMFDGRPPRDIPPGARIEYEATSGADVPWPASMGKLRPSMFMPRWASRIVLEVTKVRVQRLRDIREADCWAEGIEAVDGAFTRDQHIDMTRRLGCCIDDAKPSYALLWESINGPGSWDANPWVWAVSFRRGTP